MRVMFTSSLLIGVLFFQIILAGVCRLKVIHSKTLLLSFFFFQFLFFSCFPIILFLSGDYSNLPDEISKQVAAQFLHKNKYSDSRCDSDQQYCESNIVSCMVRYSISC